MVIVGIDYSLVSPAICIHRGADWSYNNCEFFFLTNTKKFLAPNKKIYGEQHLDWNTIEERFDNISTWALKHIKKYTNPLIFLEGYSYSSSGQVFQIGENCGLLKHKLWNNNYNFNIIPPTVIKKFATGKGNANKIDMSESFQIENPVFLEKQLLCTQGKSPASDLIDSYFLCKYGFATSNKPFTNQ